MTTFLFNTWQIFLKLAPWLLIGLTAAGILHVLLPTDFIGRHLGRGSLGNVIKAALFGVPMPLCSCGVIPAAVGLKKEGASDGAAVGFLVSTPQTGVDSIVVAYALLGLPFALFKVLAAFVTGVIAGAIVNYSHSAPHGVIAEDRDSARPRPASKTAALRQMLNFSINDLLYGIWKWIVIGVLASAAITTFLGENFLAHQSWSQGFAGMLLMLVISVPLYVCATGSVPVAASLVLAGMAPGSALVFLMAGPATNVATIGAVFKTFGRRVSIIYLSTITCGSLLFGYLFDFILRDSVSMVLHAQQHQHETTHLLTVVAAVVLLLLLLYFAARDSREFFRRHRRRGAAASAALQQQTLHVDGLRCQACVSNIRRALLAQHGVAEVEVKLDTGEVIVSGQHLKVQVLREAIFEAGYNVQM